MTFDPRRLHLNIFQGEFRFGDRRNDLIRAVEYSTYSTIPAGRPMEIGTQKASDPDLGTEDLGNKGREGDRTRTKQGKRSLEEKGFGFSTGTACHSVGDMASRFLLRAACISLGAGW